MSASDSNTKPTGVTLFHVPPRGPDDPTKVYTGSCHCGKFEYEARHPVLEDGFEVIQCNCSFCTQRGYLIIYVMDPAKNFKLTKGAHADFIRYNFYSGVATHMTCPVCGCGIFEEVRMTPEADMVVGVNVRSIKGLDLDSLRLKKLNGQVF